MKCNHLKSLPTFYIYINYINFKKILKITINNFYINNFYFPIELEGSVNNLCFLINFYIISFSCIELCINFYFVTFSIYLFKIFS